MKFSWSFFFDYAYMKLTTLYENVQPYRSVLNSVWNILLHKYLIKKACKSHFILKKHNILGIVKAIQEAQSGPLHPIESSVWVTCFHFKLIMSKATSSKFNIFVKYTFWINWIEWWYWRFKAKYTSCVSLNAYTYIAIDHQCQVWVNFYFLLNIWNYIKEDSNPVNI